MYTISYAIYLQSSCRGRRVRSFLATPSDPAPRAARAERRSETRQARRPKARSLTQQGRSDPSPRRASEPPVRTRTHQMDETERASRALRGRIGAHRLHATHDPRETTRAARQAFWSSREGRGSRGVDVHRSFRGGPDWPVRSRPFDGSLSLPAVQMPGGGTGRSCPAGSASVPSVAELVLSRFAVLPEPRVGPGQKASRETT